jgi:tetratricopeptide (TPR) repeat protein
MATQVRGLLFWLLGGLLLLTPLFVSLQVHEPFTTPKVLFVQLIATLLLLLWASKTYVGKKLTLPTHPLFLCFYAIFGWRVFTYNWALYGPEASKELYQQFALLIISIAAYFLSSRALMKKVLLAAIFAGLITSSLAMLQYYKLDGLVLETIKVEGVFDLTYLVNPIRPGSRPFLHGFDGNRNHLAGYLIALVPILVINLLYGQKSGLTPLNILSIGCLLLFVSVLLLSYCRGAWLSLSLVLLLYFFTLRKFKTLFGLFLSLFALVLALGLPELHPSWALALFAAGVGGSTMTILGKLTNKKVVILFLCTTLLAGLGGLAIPGRNPLSMAHYSLFQRLHKLLNFSDSGLLARRLETHISWHMVTASFKTVIFGRGFGQYGVHYQTIQGALLEKEEYAPFLPKVGHTSRAHNEFFQRWCEEGLIGLALALWASVVFMRSLWRRQGLREDWFLTSLVLSILTINCHSLLSFAIHKPSVAVFNATLLGFLIRLLGEKELHTGVGNSQSVSRMCSFVLVLLAVVLSNQTIHTLMAENCWAQALHLEKTGRRTEALIQLHKASSWAPGNYKLLFDLGTSLMKAKQWQRALDCFVRAEKARAIPAAAFNRAICHLQLVEPDEAEKHLRRAIYYKPNHVQAIAGLNEMLLRRKRIDEAIEITKRALAASPYSLPLLRLNAQQYARKGNLKRARLLLSEAVSLSKEPTIDLILSALLMSMKCYEQEDTLAFYDLLVKKVGAESLRKKLPPSALLVIDYYLVIARKDPKSIRDFSIAITKDVEDRAHKDMRKEAAKILKDYIDDNPQAEMTKLAYAILLSRSDVELVRVEALAYLQKLIKNLKNAELLKKAQSLMPQFLKGAH